MTKEQLAAVKKLPSCVELEGADGTWEHVVYRAENPVINQIEGENFYTKREAKACQRWLQKFAPQSKYAQIDM